ncbi:MAG: hypothetical protein CL833_06555 [Crocinitomicaceae bacterium]|nr:hypothetical protein [Crocinitomicaceae bacterium]|tara:strand:+ start:4033 stop:4320 length:288 start_codon:yes stop_codon:yes gene_type:complete
MKCPACGYTHETKTEMVDDVIRYKSGKRKGEIKEVKTKTITLEIGHEPFEKVTISNCQVVHRKEAEYDFCWDKEDREEISFNVCPECGCMFLKKD